MCSTSGGKDSTCCYILLSKFLGPTGFEAIFADTGQEHPVTVNFIKNIHTFFPGPKVTIVRADFSEQLKKRGIHATGNPFIDLTLYKHGMPSPLCRFCTSYLKMEPIMHFLKATLDGKRIVNVTGIRREESKTRSQMKEWSEDVFISRTISISYACWRPIIEWLEKNVFDFLASNNVQPNPLYSLGFKRVGCFPCVFMGKKQLALLPNWAWDKLSAWEQKLGRDWFQWLKGNGHGLTNSKDVRKWCLTNNAGNLKDTALEEPEDTPACMSTWGICE